MSGDRISLKELRARALVPGSVGVVVYPAEALAVVDAAEALQQLRAAVDSENFNRVGKGGISTNLRAAMRKADAVLSNHSAPQQSDHALEVLRRSETDLRRARSERDKLIAALQEIERMGDYNFKPHEFAAFANRALDRFKDYESEQ